MQLGKTGASHSRNSFMARSLKLIGLTEGGRQETGERGREAGVSAAYEVAN